MREEGEGLRATSGRSPARVGWRSAGFVRIRSISSSASWRSAGFVRIRSISSSANWRSAGFVRLRSISRQSAVGAQEQDPADLDYANRVVEIDGIRPNPVDLPPPSRITFDLQDADRVLEIERDAGWRGEIDWIRPNPADLDYTIRVVEICWI